MNGLDVRLTDKVRAKALLFVSVFAVTLILFAILLSSRSANVLPEQASYLPVEAELALISGPLSDFTSGAGPHLRRLTTGQSDQLTENVQSILKNFGERCIPIQTRDDLMTLGLDPERGIGLAVMEVDTTKVLLTLPIADKGAFRASLETLRGPSTKVVLSVLDPDRRVLGFDISGVEVKGGVLCGAPANNAYDGSISLIEEMAFMEPSERAGDSTSPADQRSAVGALFFRKTLGVEGVSSAPEWPSISFSCQARLSDGESLDCSCDDETGPQCTADPTSNDDAISDISVITDENGFEVWQVEDLIVLYPRSDIAIVGNDYDFLVDAVKSSGANGAAYRGDDGIMQLTRLRARDHVPGDAWLAGLYRPGGALMRSMPFSAVFSPDGLELSAGLASDALGENLTSRIIASSDNTPSLLVGDESLISVTISDKDLNLFLRLTPEEAFENNAQGQRFFRSFSPALLLLKKYSSVSSITFDFLGVRDGAPDMTLTVEGLTPEQRESLVEKLQSELKLSRDLKVLAKALSQRTVQDNGSLEELLGAEAQTLPARFLPTGENHLKPVEGAAKSAVTQDRGYRLDTEFASGYIAPPFGPNDERYLLTEEDIADLDLVGLRENRYRMAYFDDKEEDKLVLGASTAALKRFADATVRAEGIQGPTGSKGFGHVAPSRIADQLLLYPDADVREMVSKQGFAFFDQYETGHIILRNSPEFGGLSITATLRHD